MGEKMKVDLGKKNEQRTCKIQCEISAYLVPHLVVSTEAKDCCLCVSADQAENTVVSLKL